MKAVSSWLEMIMTASYAHPDTHRHTTVEAIPHANTCIPNHGGSGVGMMLSEPVHTSPPAS
eukprot:5999855-Pyramimonas_sp.AAC.2